MRTVWKWRLDQMDDVTTIKVPRGTRFLHAGVEPDSVIAVWGEVETVGQDSVHREVYVVDTGQEVPARTEYLGTCRSVSGVFVWHIYVGPEA